MILSCKLWLLVGFCIHTFVQPCSFLQINTDGGYENILFAVSDDVDESREHEVISSLKSLIVNTSQLLYHSTRGCLKFQSATILLPGSWTQRSTYQPPIDGSLLHLQADVRIARIVSNTFIPYMRTEQPPACGKPGEFIEISTSLFGPDYEGEEARDHLFLKHWARYRFGIFDEAGYSYSKVYPPAYPAEGDWKKTGCDHPYPWTHIPSRKCSVKYPGECKFNIRSRHLNSSVMSESNEFQAVSFCSSDGGTPHNTEAPTPHNAYCRHKSTWEVITNSDDYKAGGCATGSPHTFPSKTNILVRRRATLKSVLVVDPLLCQIKNNSKTTATIILSVAKALKDYFQPKDTGMLIGDTLIYDGNTDDGDLAHTFSKHCRDNKHTTMKIKETLTTAIELFDKHSNTINIVLILDGTGHDRDVTEVEDFIQEATGNIHLDLIYYPGRLFPRYQYDGKLAPYSIPRNVNDRDKCDINARVEFDLVFVSIFQRYKSTFGNPKFLLKKAFVTQKDAELDRLDSGAEGTNLMIYMCDSPEPLKPILLWNGLRLHVSHDADTGTVKNGDPLPLVVLLINYQNTR